MWVRGLKHQYLRSERFLVEVAPHVGAWIETVGSISLQAVLSSHPMWVRGLKQLQKVYRVATRESHPMWVRGLKLMPFEGYERDVRSHPMWVRGLKLYHS